MSVPSSDSNVGFMLTTAQRQQVIKSLSGCVEGMPSASAILIDRAGRVVEDASRPTGVNLPAISALAAGCYATTHELAKTVGQPEYSLLFQHEDGRQVYIWPVGVRGLLVALLGGVRFVPELEMRLKGAVGTALAEVVAAAQEPERHVPPPRIVTLEVPEEVKAKTKVLTALLLDLQQRSGGKFPPEASRFLLQARDRLARALSNSEWKEALAECESTRAWLVKNMGVAGDAQAGVVVPAVYRDLLEEIHSAVSVSVEAGRLGELYRKFYFILARKWRRMFVSESCVSTAGVDVEALWKAAAASYSNPDSLAPEFAAALDEMIRELLRVVHLAKGPGEREAVAKRLARRLHAHRDRLLALGLESQVGRSWVPVKDD